MTATYGTRVQVSATVSPADATGTITFGTAGGGSARRRVSGGTTSCETGADLKAGPYSVVASYDGDPNHLPEQARFVFRVQR